MSRMLALSCLLLALALASTSVSAQRSHEFDPYLEQPPLAATAQVGKGTPPVLGCPAPHLQVVIRNVTADKIWRQRPQAIVVRAVSWESHPPDTRTWLRRLFGEAAAQGDGSFMYDGSQPGQTSVAFETGLIFPGENLTVPLPAAPQSARDRILVYFAEVGAPDRWESDILIPDINPDVTLGSKIPYLPATPPRLHRRLGQGGFALLASTFRPGATPLPLRSIQLPVTIPLQADPRGRASGGMTRAEAVRRAHLPPVRLRKGMAAAPVHAVYRSFASAWFVVNADGQGVAVVRARRGWEERKLPKMERTAAEMLGTSPMAVTMMLLRPRAFADLLAVRTPRQTHGGFEEGLTAVRANRLWSVLDRARDQGLAVKRVRCDPDGRGTRETLSAGVEVDPTGLWLNPEP